MNKSSSNPPEKDTNSVPVKPPLTTDCCNVVFPILKAVSKVVIVTGVGGKGPGGNCQMMVPDTASPTDTPKRAPGPVGATCVTVPPKSTSQLTLGTACAGRATSREARASNTPRRPDGA